jgi:hypothetical protein
MTKKKKEFVDTLYNGKDPFQGADEWYLSEVEDYELYTWGSKHPFIRDSLEKTNASMYIESGSWKGGSAINAALWMKENNVDGVVVCIDTWLGCHLLFKHAAVQSALKREFGRANLWKSFYANCIKHGVKDYIVPIHLDSQSGYKLINGKHRNGFSWASQFDVAYVDSSHISPMVKLDIEEAWQCLRVGGHLIGDDYIPDQNTIDYDASDFRGVYKDFQEFSKEKNIEIEHNPAKARLIKNV